MKSLFSSNIRLFSVCSQFAVLFTFGIILPTEENALVLTAFVIEALTFGALGSSSIICRIKGELIDRSAYVVTLIVCLLLASLLSKLLLFNLTLPFLLYCLIKQVFLFSIHNFAYQRDHVLVEIYEKILPNSIMLIGLFLAFPNISSSFVFYSYSLIYSLLAALNMYKNIPLSFGKNRNFLAILKLNWLSSILANMDSLLVATFAMGESFIIYRYSMQVCRSALTVSTLKVIYRIKDYEPLRSQDLKNKMLYHNTWNTIHYVTLASIGVMCILLICLYSGMRIDFQVYFIIISVFLRFVSSAFYAESSAVLMSRQNEDVISFLKLTNFLLSWIIFGILMSMTDLQTVIILGLSFLIVNTLISKIQQSRALTYV